MDTGESGHLHKVDTYIGNRWFPAEFLTSKSLQSGHSTKQTHFWHEMNVSFEMNLSKGGGSYLAEVGN